MDVVGQLHIPTPKLPGESPVCQFDTKPGGEGLQAADMSNNDSTSVIQFVDSRNI